MAADYDIAISRHRFKRDVSADPGRVCLGEMNPDAT
jgi:hypothetical protein